MNKHFKNKVAWVTGSSRGIGRCIAELLAAEGCNVAVSGRNQTNLQFSGEGSSVDEVAAGIVRRHGVKCVAVCGELSREEEVARCADEVHRALGPIDFLVCAAGGGNVGSALRTHAPKGSASAFETDYVHAILDHNLISTMLCCRAVVPDMRGPGGAYISGQVIRVDGGEQLSPC
ncbi:MAG: SDR family oxidoreductase [Kiritimatiellae bacterium]|nr:SDR family oxidoreductase [Kiritimatiellia bacterium]